MSQQRYLKYKTTPKSVESIPLTRHFGQGPKLEGGCSGTALCHYMARKFHNDNQTINALWKFKELIFDE